MRKQVLVIRKKAVLYEVDFVQKLPDYRLSVKISSQVS